MNRIVLYTVTLLSFSLAFSQSKEREKTAREVQQLVSEANKDYVEGNFSSAEAKYRQAIGKDAKNVTAKYNLGNMYYESEKNEEAIRRYVQAAEVSETKYEKHKAFHNLGNAFMNQKNYAGAVDAYKNALRNNPQDDETRYNLALAKKMLEQNPQDDGGSGDEQNQEDSQQQEDQESEGDNQEGNEGDSQENEDDSDNGEDTDEGDDKEDKGSPEEQQGDSEDQTPQPVEGQLSPQQIQSLLEAMNNEERKVQDKINAEKQKGATIKSDKDW